MIITETNSTIISGMIRTKDMMFMVLMAIKLDIANTMTFIRRGNLQKVDTNFDFSIAI